MAPLVAVKLAVPPTARAVVGGLADCCRLLAMTVRLPAAMESSAEAEGLVVGQV